MEKLKINFVLPPSHKISGGPLAILEYANRLIDKGHTVTITTYPDNFWDGKNPFPWFNFKGQILYKKSRKNSGALIGIAHLVRKFFPHLYVPSFIKNFYRQLNLKKLGVVNSKSYQVLNKESLDFLAEQLPIWLGLIEAMPSCDLNIATVWTTTFPVFLSKKGKPVYFMQHYEEVFYPFETNYILQRLLTRSSYDLPIYKIANSSWLQSVIKEKHQQVVPFSNNGLEISDFNPMNKLSLSDGVIRIITYSRPEQWKGFADAVQAMARIKNIYKEKVEWHVFGYLHQNLNESNEFAPYKFHQKLSFKELAELYATSDIALCASWYESFPLPPLEAMASGTAVITTDMGTEDYAFDQKNSLVVKARDIDGMVNAILKLINHKNFRENLAQEGRKTAEKFNWEFAVTAREKLLYSIHNNSELFDIYSRSKTGLYDFSGCEFEKSAHHGLPDKGILTFHAAKYMFYQGAKHKINDLNLMDYFKKYGFIDFEVDKLIFESIPLGPEIYNEYDIPNS
jgi:glycosyltransferase involved in cell wall biosynthesis